MVNKWDTFSLNRYSLFYTLNVLYFTLYRCWSTFLYINVPYWVFLVLHTKCALFYPLLMLIDFSLHKCALLGHLFFTLMCPIGAPFLYTNVPYWGTFSLNMFPVSLNICTLFCSLLGHFFINIKINEYIKNRALSHVGQVFVRIAFPTEYKCFSNRV